MEREPKPDGLVGWAGWKAIKKEDWFYLGGAVLTAPSAAMEMANLIYQFFAKDSYKPTTESYVLATVPGVLGLISYIAGAVIANRRT